MAVSRNLRRQVIERAGACCEYCCMPAALDAAPFQVDHIRAEKHHGLSVAANLAWACFPCNNHKGTNLSGVDPYTERMVSLFHPRHNDWGEHFEWHGPYLVGKTAIGRATIDVLAINSPDRVAYRRELLAVGLFPPKG